MFAGFSRRLIRWKTMLAVAAVIALDSIYSLVLGVRRRMNRRPLRSPVALLVRLGPLEDFLLSLPATQALVPSLRQKGFRVVMLAAPEGAPLLEPLKSDIELWPLDLRRWQGSLSYRWAMARKLSDLRADIALELSFTRSLRDGDSVIRFSNAARRIGWEGEQGSGSRWGHRLGLRFYNKPLKNPPKSPLPESEALERLLAQLGVPLEPLGKPPFSADQLKAPPEMGLPEQYVILSPGAASPLTRWPEANFAALADSIHQHYGLPILLCGSQDDAAHAAVVMALSSAVLADLCGKISLADLPALLANASLVVGCEGPLVHLASLVGTPSLVITGGMRWGRVLPYGRSRLLPVRRVPTPLNHPMPCYGCQGICRYPIQSDEAAPCVASVPPAQAIGALTDYLTKPATPKTKPAASKEPKPDDKDQPKDDSGD